MHLALLWPDTHAPYHNVRAVELVLKVIEDLKLHELIIMGDFADCYAVSSHGKHAKMQHQLLQEIDKCNELLDLVDLATTAKKVYLMGNHEHRLERFIFDK
jgi:metallophosphoesterase superfamily enzyme